MKLNVTYCSGNKVPGVHSPDTLYISNRISAFIEKCKIIDSKWAIFSALYGFFFPEEEKPNYDFTFRTDHSYWLGIAAVVNGRKLSREQSKAHIDRLSSELRNQAKMQQLDQIVFFGPSPKMMKCYLAVLHYAFDYFQCSHGWAELIEHVKSQSKMIEVIHKLDSIAPS